jgi:predicted enzyme related to lactoylglutathione lyase
MAAVNAFVCTVDVADLDAMVARLVEAGGTVALPKMPIPTVGWLAYGKDTEGNIFGMMQMDPKAA